MNLKSLNELITQISKTQPVELDGAKDDAESEDSEPEAEVEDAEGCS